MDGETQKRTFNTETWENEDAEMITVSCEPGSVSWKAQIIVEMLRQEARLMAEWGAAAELFVRTVKHAAQRCECMMMLW